MWGYPVRVLCSCRRFCCNGLMQFNTYGGTAAQLAAALVNLDDFRPARLTTLLGQHEIVRPSASARQAEEIAEWASMLSEAFGADPSRQVSAVNHLLEMAASRPYVSTHDGNQPHIHYVSDDADLVARVRATTAGGLTAALCYAGGDRLGRCERAGCNIVFVDTSRNGRRRFCSLACANRVNVAAHRARASH